LDDRLKQRLVGAIVLVALAVIFIPMILDGEHGRTLPPFGQAIPEKPAVLKDLEADKIPPVAVPPPPGIVERQLVDKNTATLKPETTAVVKTTPATSATRTATTPVAKKAVKAWVVQVGSFTSRKNAMALSNKLRKQQYPAFVEAVKTGGNWTYRVRVGPEVRRSSSEATQKALLMKLKINGVVMEHP